MIFSGDIQTTFVEVVMRHIRKCDRDWSVQPALQKEGKKNPLNLICWGMFLILENCFKHSSGVQADDKNICY